MSQPIGPNESCKTIKEYKQDTKYTIIYINFGAEQAIFISQSPMHRSSEFLDKVCNKR
jgi:hypothetical protein